ncbi:MULTISPECIES: GNAT family N-acetyltransferase [Arthrobacter]|uniref:GNAT family N-acetyltransferase n=2 Tax=Arthrobacter TaxID=1663 RepID=A0ABU9KLN8_9MICC|nr:GNAT family N-acetyltransferase [Arthrobacter sp. YJM1]MDP5228442.1 GNAT family N-acetyltransferase [Arthrobacter sp. YJM1]
MTPEDFPAVQALELAAGQLFRQVGMASIADDEAFSDAELAGFVAAAQAWVLTLSTETDDGAVAAYAVGETLDGAAHLEQLSVHPQHARQGLGARLLEFFRATARERGESRVTLTTFRDVPWNAPYYARLGFAELPEAAWGPELRAKVAGEAAHGLDRWPRVVMAAEI